MGCNSCNAVMINGVYCHETGCPDAWKDTKKECLWCGERFIREHKEQTTCSNECHIDYYG